MQPVCCIAEIHRIRSVFAGNSYLPYATFNLQVLNFAA